MKLSFYIVSKGRREKRFDSATELDCYVKSHKLPKSSIIELRLGKIVSGSISVQNYLNLEKNGMS